MEADQTENLAEDLLRRLASSEPIRLLEQTEKRLRSIEAENVALRARLARIEGALEVIGEFASKANQASGSKGAKQV